MKIVIVPHPKYPKSEVVERKGIGHPDSICDGVAEAVSRALSRAYIKETGHIQHHNVDKVTLAAGRSRTSWGGGEILRPIRIFIVGRANYSVPVETIAIKAARDYLHEILPLARDEHFVIDPRVGEGASELISTVENVVANDTSVGVGFAPFTEAERITKEIADFLNSREFMREWPEVGPDIKVMTHRDGELLDITIAAAFVDRFLGSIEEYRRSKEAIEERIREKFELRDAVVKINALDNYEKGMVYLTVIGTSAEQGDDGSVGRGTRVNGLITPTRPMSLEAAAGKNPVSHVGKLYNVLAQQIAERIYAETGKPAEVMIQSRIGYPITDPPLVLVRTDASDIENIVKEEIEKLPEITMKIVEGKIRVF